jgi:hypothetical protein
MQEVHCTCDSDVPRTLFRVLVCAWNHPALTAPPQCTFNGRHEQVLTQSYPSDDDDDDKGEEDDEKEEEE